MRTALALVVLLGVAPACRTAGTGEPPRTWPLAAYIPDTLPPSLLKRLSEAIDGYRDGKPRWIVADRKFQIEGRGHKVVGLFLDTIPAVAARLRARTARGQRRRRKAFQTGSGIDAAVAAGGRRPP